MHHNLNLNWLRTFEAAARHLSFTAASKELGLTQSAVSLQVKSLETKLGQNLFIRRPKSLQLTDIAKAYLPSVRDSLVALDLAEFELMHDVSSTRLQVDTFVAACEFVACELGCAVVLERFAINAIESGRAIQCTGEPVPLGQSHYFVDRATGKETHAMAKAFKAWLRPLFTTPVREI